MTIFVYTPAAGGRLSFEKVVYASETAVALLCAGFTVNVSIDNLEFLGVRLDYASNTIVSDSTYTVVLGYDDSFQPKALPFGVSEYDKSA